MARKPKKSPDAGHSKIVDETRRKMPASGDPINEIALVYREYVFAENQCKRVNCALGAYLRLCLGWRKDLPAKERKAIATAAQSIANNPANTGYDEIVGSTDSSRASFDAMKELTSKRMENLAKSLPVWAGWGQHIRGFGAKSLAKIVAEAGDLSNYADKGKLWKRLGLAVMDGRRQGRVAADISREDRKQAYIEHAYNPRRRSVIWNIGEPMIKAQVRNIKGDDGESTGEKTALGEYGAIYLARKAYELARDPDMTPMHAHRRAQRYMEKRLLKDLWQAWRAKPVVSNRTKFQLPAEIQAASHEVIT